MEAAPAWLDVELRVDPEVPTVLALRWTAPPDTADALTVEIDGGGARERTVELADAGATEVVLWGFKPSSAVRARVVARAGGLVVARGEASTETGPVPAELPRMDVTVRDPDAAWDGYLALSPLTISYVTVIDADGDYVWWWRRDDVDVDRRWIRVVELTADGRSLVYLAVSAEPEDVGDVVWVSLDGHDVASHELLHAHHDLASLPDGTAAVLVEDVRDVDGETVHGDRIVEVDADGNEVEVFSVWDHLEYEPDAVGVDAGTGWTHANALVYVEEEDTYLISMRNLDSVWSVERATGRPAWRLGGEVSDFVLDGDEWFDRQHGVSMAGDEVLVFSNGDSGALDSHALGYRLDREAGVATNHWRFGLDPPVFTYAYGDVDHLPGGSALITWSTAGLMRQVRGDEVLWELESELGSGLGYPQPLEASLVESVPVWVRAAR